MRRSGKAGAITNPQHMGRRIVPIARQAVLPGHSLFIAEQQSFVAGEEAGGFQLRHGIGGQTNGGHEVQRFAEAVSQLRILRRPRAARGEIKIPAVHLMQIGKAAGRKGPQQIERGR